MHKINTPEIRKILATTFDDFEEAKMLAKDATLQIIAMRLSPTDTMEVTWSKILKQAEREGKEFQLIETVYKKFPGNREIAQIYEQMQKPNLSDETDHSNIVKQQNKPKAPDIQLTLFYSYAHNDEPLRNELDRHLSLLRNQGLIAQLYDGDIGAGTEWASQIDHYLDTADIIVLLVSSDFLASNYCYSIEMKRALERHKSGNARVIPILLRPVDWQDAPFAKLQVLPKNAQPVTTWENRDLAFEDIAQQIRKVVNELRKRRGFS